MAFLRRKRQENKFTNLGNRFNMACSKTIAAQIRSQVMEKYFWLSSLLSDAKDLGLLAVDEYQKLH